VQLSDDERRMRDGGAGHAARKAMEILVALGEIYEAERLIPIGSAQLAGVSYANLGDAGLELLEDWARDGRVVVPAALNPAGMDLRAWREMGVPADFAERQLRVVAAYQRMGATLTCTCTPYLSGLRPAAGEHLAWSESSAVTFANSVLGARTNREGGPSALAAALCGRTPAYGLHLDGPRAPAVTVRVEAPLGSAADWGALGAAIGRRAPGLVPRIEAPEPPGEESLMALAAALPTFGGAPLFHLAGTTPEAERYPRPADELALGRRELDEAYAALDDGAAEPDLVFLGCPHATLATLRRVARRLEGRRVRTTLWVATSRAVREQAEREGLAATIAAAGGLLVADTCFVVAPLRGRFARAWTDSAKGCFYARGPNAMRVRLAALDECLDAALGGGPDALGGGERR
jgi:predicted aconitase